MLESKTKNVESKTEKCGVQISIFTSRNQLFWALTDSYHSIQSSLIVLPDVVAITQYYAIKAQNNWFLEVKMYCVIATTSGRTMSEDCIEW